MKKVIIRTEEELNQHIDGIRKLNDETNSSVFTDAVLLKYAFKDALKKEQSPFIIAIYDDHSRLQALIPLYCLRGKKLQILWDKTSDYVDVLASETALSHVKAEFNELLKLGYSFCLNKIKQDSKVFNVAEDFRAPLQRIAREKLEHAWAISKLNGLPKLNTRDLKRRKSQFKKRGIKVEYVDKDSSDKKIRESILEITYLKYEEFASRNRPYDLNLELDDFIELISSLVKEDKAFIAKAVNPNSLIDAAILFFKDSTSVYSIMPAFNLHAPHSPGLSLMYHTIEDFLEGKSGLAVYDFTIGDEAYKKRLSNRKTRIHTIHISDLVSKRILYFLIYRTLDYIKSITAVNNLKIVLMNKSISVSFFIKRFISKVKDYTSAGLFSAMKRYISNKTSSVLLFKREYSNTEQAIGFNPNQYGFSSVNFPDIIKFYSQNFSNKYEAWDKIDVSMYRMSNNFIPYGLFLDENLVSLAWMQRVGKYVVGEEDFTLDLKEDECAILDVMTDRNHRRKGLYSLLQYNMLTSDEIKNKTVILHTTTNNIASISAHKKLGYTEFTRIG